MAKNKIPLNVRQDLAKSIAQNERLKGGDYNKAYKSAMRQLQRVGTETGSQKRKLGNNFKDKIIRAKSEYEINTVESYISGKKESSTEFYRYEQEVPEGYIVYKRLDVYIDNKNDALELCRFWEFESYQTIFDEAGADAFVCLILGVYFPAGTYTTIQKTKRDQSVFKYETRRAGFRVIVKIAVRGTD